MNKKTKPALFELINKSTLKPPAWAYPDKKEPARNATQSESGKDPTSKRPFIPPHVATPVKPSRPVKKHYDFKQFAVLAKKLTGGLSFTTLAIIVTGIAVSVAIVVLFNQPKPETAAEAPPATTVNPPAAPPSATGQNSANLPNELVTLQNQPPRDDIWPDARFSTEIDSEATKPADLANSSPAPALTGQCWVLCGNKERDPLFYIQKYFNDNGLDTLVGKFDGRFVLVTRQTFASSRGDEAKNLKNMLENIGKYYNNNRPEGAPSYSLATFQSAYAVNIERIDLN